MNWKFNRQQPPTTLQWSKPMRTGVKLKINGKKGVMSLDINLNGWEIAARKMSFRTAILNGSTHVLYHKGHERKWNLKQNDFI
jgi:hypothetical protein